jgi:hypothetical protein
MKTIKKLVYYFAVIFTVENVFQDVDRYFKWDFFNNSHIYLSAIIGSLFFVFFNRVSSDSHGHPSDGN